MFHIFQIYKIHREKLLYLWSSIILAITIQTLLTEIWNSEACKGPEWIFMYSNPLFSCIPKYIIKNKTPQSFFQLPTPFLVEVLEQLRHRILIFLPSEWKLLFSFLSMTLIQWTRRYINSQTARFGCNPKIYLWYSGMEFILQRKEEMLGLKASKGYAILYEVHKPNIPKFSAARAALLRLAFMVGWTSSVIKNSIYILYIARNFYKIRCF